MELNITAFFNNAAPMDYSASVAEIGRNAGAVTWRAACADAQEFNLLDTDEKREAFRAHVAGFGAWDEEEIAAMSDVELNALFIQYISGDMRGCPDVDMGPGMTSEDWAAVQEMQERGTIASDFFRGTDGQIYYNLSV